jgi:hypothetical protein
LERSTDPRQPGNADATPDLVRADYELKLAVFAGLAGLTVPEVRALLVEPAAAEPELEAAAE